MTGPTVTLAEAARRSHLSLPTIRRWIKADKLAGAVRTAEGWSIPVASLVEAGAWESATPADTSPEASAADLELVAEVARVQAELAIERTRRKAAEQLQAAAERNADDLRHALRMLEAGRH
jgi:hypothetical protein